MSALELSGIVAARGARIVLHDATSTFAAGRLTAVIGPNGAGKSSLLDVAAGLLRPQAGSVLFGGVALSSIDRRELARRRAYLPQRAGVEWPISIERTVALGLTPSLPTFGALPAALHPAVEAALARYDLTELRDRPATELSGGELARVMLARATVGEPELLIVDEPTAGLDPRHSLDAGRRLSALAQGGCTVIVALHDLDLAVRIADDVVALKEGRILAAGPSQSVFTEEVLAELYDVEVAVRQDDTGTSVRFG